MNQMLPYALIGLLAVVFFLSLLLVVRNFKRSLSDILERLMSMDNELEELKNAGKGETEDIIKNLQGEIEDIRKTLQGEAEDIRKALQGQSAANSEEIGRKSTQVKEDIRAALKTYIESIIRKISENDAAQKGMYDNLSSQFVDLQQKLLHQAAKPVHIIPSADAEAPSPQPAPPQPSPVAASKQQAAAPDDAHAKARRLARLIVSDIALYNRKNVELGVKEGKFLELLEHDIKEARALYARRVPEEIRTSTSYLDDAFQELYEKTKQELNL